MTTTLIVERDFPVGHQGRGANGLPPGPASAEPAAMGRVPRVARLLALALRFEGLLREGAVRDYAELARLGQVSRARLSQVMSLLQLAPDLQEAVLFLPRTQRGRDPLILADLLPLAALPAWPQQRRRWARLCARQLGPATDRPSEAGPAFTRGRAPGAGSETPASG